MINAFIDHYAHTLMSDNKRDVLTLENIIMMIGQTENILLNKALQ